MSELDLEAIAAEHLRQCGPCDYGLPMGCNCPTGDPRVAISRLIDEVKRLRGDRNPRIDTLVRILDGYGMRLAVVDDEQAAQARIQALRAELAQLEAATR